MSPWALLRTATLWFGAAAALPLPAQPPSGQLDASPTLFTVMAALNAAGFDEGLTSPNSHPLRAQLRAWVARRQPVSLPALKEFYLSHRTSTPAAELSQYVTYALSIGAPPDFKPRFAPHLMPPEAAALEGLGVLLARFYREAELEQAFRSAQPFFDQVIGLYHEPVTNAILEANSYLRNPTSGLRGRRFQIFIELLAPPNYVMPRLLADDFFVVVTPSPQPRVHDIRHAYLDYLIDPLAIRFSGALESKKPLGELALASPILPEEYKNDFSRLAAKSAVYAIQARLDRPNSAALVARAMREGFILTAHFFESLPAYEKQEASFALYFRTMIESIDLAKEDHRIAQLEFASERAVRKVAAPAQPAPELSAAEQECAQAERLYQQRALDEAAAAFRRVLAAGAPRPLHARATFGLARIALLQKNPALSQQLFERTLELDPEPFERAWALVYLARLARASRDLDSAARHYRAALEVAGASQAARQAALTELAQLASQPTPPQAP